MSLGRPVRTETRVIFLKPSLKGVYIVPFLRLWCGPANSLDFHSFFPIQCKILGFFLKALISLATTPSLASILMHSLFWLNS